MPKKTKEKTTRAKKIKDSPQKIKEKEKPLIIKSKETSKRLKYKISHKNPLQCNESIVKSILDRIISISVRKANLNILINHLDDYYFDYLKNQINMMFSTSNIFYSDEPENSIIDNSSFWKTEYNKCNTWVEIAEPNTLRCDRFENAFINYVDIKKDSSADNKELLPGDNNIQKDNKNINDKKNKNKKLLKKYTLKGNKNDLDVLEEKSSGESNDEETKSHIKRSTYKNNFKNNANSPNKSQSLQKNNFSPNKSSNISISPTNKRSRNEILEMATKEIPGINEEYDHRQYEPSNINFLRREREDQIMRKAKESKKIFFNIQKNDNNQIIIDNNEPNKEVKKIKMFDSNKLTFDSNGKIISFKPIKIDVLSKDFAILKNSVRAFRKRRTTLRRTLKPKEETSETMKEKEKDKDKDKDKDNITINEQVIRNPIDAQEGLYRNQYMKSVLEKNEKIVPSGSNFSIMLPNIGVVLKENEQVKKGNREFGKFFKKYSLEDYDKILKDYVPIQNKTMMINKLGKIVKSPLNKSISRQFFNNTNNNNDFHNNALLSTLSFNNNNANNSVILNNNSEISNPLINENDNNTNTNYINYNIKTMKMNKNSFNNSLLSSNINNLSLSPKSNNISNISNNRFAGSIKLNKNGISSLKVEFDSLQDLDYNNINNYYSPSSTGMKNINIFGNNYRDIFKNIIKRNNNISKDLNEFNKNIITSKGWGNKTMRKNMSSENLLFGKHQTKYQAIRELGSKVLNSLKVKMPRSRKINIQI